MKNDKKVFKPDHHVKNLIRTYEPTGMELEEYLERLRHEKGFARIYVHRTTNKIIAGFLNYNLCKKHNIPFEVIYLNFKSRDELYRWVITDHLQKTNLSNWARCKLAIDYFNDYFEKLAKANQRLSKGRGQKGQKKQANHFEKIDTNERLAQKAGVGRAMITDVKYILDNKKDAPEGLFDKLDNETVSVNNARTIVWRKKKNNKKNEDAETRLEYINDLSKGVENSVLHMDAEKGVRLIPDGSLTLCFTSPPFAKGMDYHEVKDSETWQDNMKLMRRVFKALKPKFRKGGRCIIEFQPVRTKEKNDQGNEYNRPVQKYLVDMMQDLGYSYRCDIIWDKCRVGNNPLGTDADCSPYSPRIRDMHSTLFVFYVDSWKLPCTNSNSDLPFDKFDEYTKSIWRIPAETHGYGTHSCPFPVDLAQRAIETFSHVNDLTIDPFGGSASCAIAAIRSHRRFVYVDLSETSSAEAKERIEKEMNKLNTENIKAA